MDPQKEEMNKGISSDSSSALSNVFTSYSVKYLGLLMLVNFSLFIILVTLEFIVKYRHINKIIMKIDFLHSGYKLTNNLLYAKFFITEGVIANTLNQSGINYEPLKVFFKIFRKNCIFIDKNLQKILMFLVQINYPKNSKIIYHKQN